LELGRTDPIISYVTTRTFAEKNPAVVEAFRESIAEAAPIVNGDHEKTSLAISNFTKQPIDIVRANVFSHSSPELKGSDFAWWLEVMKQQDMLQAPIDASKLVAP
jgi:NitT/TauT family transport system substrate-binding protein